MVKLICYETDAEIESET